MEGNRIEALPVYLSPHVVAVWGAEPCFPRIGVGAAHRVQGGQTDRQSARAPSAPGRGLLAPSPSPPGPQGCPNPPPPRPLPRLPRPWLPANSGHTSATVSCAAPPASIPGDQAELTPSPRTRAACASVRFKCVPQAPQIRVRSQGASGPSPGPGAAPRWGSQCSRPTSCQQGGGGRGRGEAAPSCPAGDPRAPPPGSHRNHLGKTAGWPERGEKAALWAGWGAPGGRRQRSGRPALI